MPTPRTIEHGTYLGTKYRGLTCMHDKIVHLPCTPCNRICKPSRVLSHTLPPPPQIVTQLTEGGLHTYTYADCLRRSKLAALAVQRLGVRPGDRLATMAWNNHRHLELW